jgi:branched-subunit amino acid transport protein AzlD
MNGMGYSFAVVVICTLVTWLTRALPFLVFGKRSLPPLVKYLGNVLPAMIMVILVVYCLRNTDFAGTSHGICELTACVSVLTVHRWKKNTYLSIVVGTIIYMFMIRII